jgi:hypothetical protein
LAVVPIAIALVSCGGDSLTGPSAIEPAVDSAVVTPPLKVVTVDSASADDDTLGEAVSLCKKEKVLICHRGRNKWVPKRAVRGHLRHGDTRGACDAAVSCPCYSVEDIQSTAEQCNGTVNPTCSTSGEQVSLLLACDPGGTVPPGILGIYLTRTSDGGYCSRNETSGAFTESPLSAEQYEACKTAITSSGYCS